MSQTGNGASRDSKKSRRRQVYGLDRKKSYYGQETNESYGLRIVIIGILLALLMGLVVLGGEALR